MIFRRMITNIVANLNWLKIAGMTTFPQVLSADGVSAVGIYGANNNSFVKRDDGRF